MWIPPTNNASTKVVCYGNTAFNSYWYRDLSIKMTLKPWVLFPQCVQEKFLQSRVAVECINPRNVTKASSTFRVLKQKCVPIKACELLRAIAGDNYCSGSFMFIFMQLKGRFTRAESKESIFGQLVYQLPCPPNGQNSQCRAMSMLKIRDSIPVSHVCFNSSSK